MRIVFRTDASLQIGTGHVMRCLTLANTLRSAGAHCQFICRDHVGNLIEQIRRCDFEVCVLPTVNRAFTADNLAVAGRSSHTEWLGADWVADAAETKAWMETGEVDWLIVDHYALTVLWEQTLRPMSRKLMVIDDLADRSHDCDLLLDQNLGRSAGDYKHFIPLGCTVLAGPNYALLRPEFAALRDESLRRRATSQLKHLLISMGGVDQSDATCKVLEALKDCPLTTDMRITVVMGPSAPWLEHVQRVAKQMPQPTVVKINVNNMAQLMADSDMAIGAAGSTSWERCCMGLPSLIVVLADNQRDIAAALKQSGSAKVIDSVDAIPYVLRSMIDSLVTSKIELNQLIKSSSLVTDGIGANRVKDCLYEHNI